MPNGMALKNGIRPGEAICTIEIPNLRTQKNGHHSGNKPSDLQVAYSFVKAATSFQFSGNPI